MTAVADWLDAKLLGIPEVRAGKMFGHRAYYVNGKMFACIYRDVIGLKLSETKAADLIASGQAEPFQPYGKRRTRQWIQLSCTVAVLHDHQDTIQASLNFVQTVKREATCAN